MVPTRDLPSECSGDILPDMSTCHFMRFDKILAAKLNSKLFLSNALFMLRCPLRFELLLQGEDTYQKKLNVITSPLSSSNRGTQSCNDRITPSEQNPLVFTKSKTPI